MSNIHIHDLIDELHFPINSISVEGKVIHIGNFGTCVMKGNSITDLSLNWKKIYEANKKKIDEMIYSMYEYDESQLEIIPKPERVLELKIKGTEMGLPSVQYNYTSNGDWSLQRVGY